MNALRKRAVRLGLLGFVLGMLVGVAILLLSENDALSLSSAEKAASTILYLLLSGVNGAVCWGSTVVYGIESWSILRSTVTHFFIAFGSLFLFFCAGIALGLMQLPSPGICLLILAACLAVYVLIWLGQYLVYQRKVKKMNLELKAWKARRRQV